MILTNCVKKVTVRNMWHVWCACVGVVVVNKALSLPTVARQPRIRSSSPSAASPDSIARQWHAATTLRLYIVTDSDCGFKCCEVFISEHLLLIEVLISSDFFPRCNFCSNYFCFDRFCYGLKTYVLSFKVHRWRLAYWRRRRPAASSHGLDSQCLASMFLASLYKVCGNDLLISRWRQQSLPLLKKCLQHSVK